MLTTTYDWVWVSVLLSVGERERSYRYTERKEKRERIYNTVGMHVNIIIYIHTYAHNEEDDNKDWM